MLIKPIPGEFLCELGRINVQWTSLEATVNLALIALLGKDFGEGRPHVVFAHLNFHLKMDILTCLVEELLEPPVSLQDFGTNIKRLLSRASKERNKMLHSVWDFRDGKVIRSMISARNKLSMEQSTVTLKELEQVANHIILAELALGRAVFPEAEQFRSEDKMKKLH